METLYAKRLNFDDFCEYLSKKAVFQYEHNKKNSRTPVPWSMPDNPDYRPKQRHDNRQASPIR